MVKIKVGDLVRINRGKHDSEWTIRKANQGYVEKIYERNVLLHMVDMEGRPIYHSFYFKEDVLEVMKRA